MNFNVRAYGCICLYMYVHKFVYVHVGIHIHVHKSQVRKPFVRLSMPHKQNTHTPLLMMKTHTHPYTHKYTQKKKRIHSHTYAHTRTHTHTHTHIFTHGRSPSRTKILPKIPKARLVVGIAMMHVTHADSAGTSRQKCLAVTSVLLHLTVYVCRFIKIYIYVGNAF